MPREAVNTELSDVALQAQPLPIGAASIPSKASVKNISKRHGGRLFRRYALYLAGLLSAGLLLSGAIGAYFFYRDTRTLVEELQREKARAAAARIEQFILGVESQLRGAAYLGRAGAADFDRRFLELARLLRLAPSVSDAAWLDSEGRERVRVSRLGRDTVNASTDRSTDHGYILARGGGAWRGEVVFRRHTEPHIAVMVPGIAPEDGIVAGDINLRFVSEVVSEIRIGIRGLAYVVDGQGRLIAHPDSAKVLRMSNLGHLPHVQEVLARQADRASLRPATVVRTDAGTRTLTAHASIAALGWHVFVEQPLEDAFAPLYEAVARVSLLLLIGIALAIAVSVTLARRMITPIADLQRGAQRISEGHLDERVVVRTEDELHALADQFNRMAQSLRDSQAGLEHKIRERTRQLEDANRAKTRFLAAASHDLRQPVHALGLFIAQLKETRNENARDRLIERVAVSSNAVADLIEALLDISRLDAGSIGARPVEFNLQSLFDRIEHACAPVAVAKGLRLRIRPTVLWIRTDPVLLERILLNLCANAIRHTRQGGAILTARIRGAHVRIQVWDTGVGIAPEQQSKIFEEFYQVGPPIDGESKGLGLGLAIVDRLATLLGCRVTVRSTPARGSVFALDVPRAGSDQPAVMRGAEPVFPTRFDGMRLIVIDDDAEAREATEGLLRQWGCKVLSARDGREALRLLGRAAGPPDLVVSDYRLGPDERGTDVVQVIRARFRRDIPAIIVSANAGTALQEECLAGGVHFLQKPLNAARLRALLAHIAAPHPTLGATLPSEGSHAERKPR
jgi:signal transduction histidine kinase/ActR/RegA family two-component response regulator